MQMEKTVTSRILKRSHHGHYDAFVFCFRFYKFYKKWVSGNFGNESDWIIEEKKSWTM